MAEKTILVCDVCGQPASESVSFKFGRRSLTKDLCDAHLAELTTGARSARRGRRPGTVVKGSSNRQRRPRKAAVAAPKSPRRRGRPRKKRRVSLDRASRFGP
jgi:hypothetical protein